MIKVGAVIFALFATLHESVGHPFVAGDRLAFYGDSNTAWGEYPRHVENYYAKFYPELRLKVANEGEPGDCISVGYYWRLDHNVLSANPTVLFVMFGINDLNWGRNLTQASFDTFNTHAGLTVNKALRAGVRDVYMLSYPATDVTLPGADQDLCSQIPAVSDTEDSPLQRVGDQSIALSKQTCFNGRCGKGLDIERPMRELVHEAREQGIRFHGIDGVHLNALGNKVVASLILTQLGEPADQVKKFLDEQP